MLATVHGLSNATETGNEGDHLKATGAALPEGSPVGRKWQWTVYRSCFAISAVVCGLGAPERTTGHPKGMEAGSDTDSPEVSIVTEKREILELRKTSRNFYPEADPRPSEAVIAVDSPDGLMVTENLQTVNVMPPPSLYQVHRGGRAGPVCNNVEVLGRSGWHTIVNGPANVDICSDAQRLLLFPCKVHPMPRTCKRGASQGRI
ncbi:hypothetical protein DFJ77DRAFT_443633 [Powellomyces hirtus]|nr:hypothetical protein DFJ77DRAFT_443633 [Powellomyces hirtus]